MSNFLNNRVFRQHYCELLRIIRGQPWKARDAMEAFADKHRYPRHRMERLYKYCVNRSLE
jgi:hypothetical protein